MSDRPRSGSTTSLGRTPSTSWGRAYRAGRLVCARVCITIGYDDRLGLTRRERRYVIARFQDHFDGLLRDELVELVRHRGAAALRVAERIDPIEFVIDDADLGYPVIVGCLQRPQIRHGQLRDVKFGVRELTQTR